MGISARRVLWLPLSLGKNQISFHCSQLFFFQIPLFQKSSVVGKRNNYTHVEEKYHLLLGVRWLNLWEGLKQQALDCSSKDDSQNTTCNGPMGELPTTVGESEADEWRNPRGGPSWIQGSGICHLHHHSHCPSTPTRLVTEHWKAAVEKQRLRSHACSCSGIPLGKTLR